MMRAEPTWTDARTDGWSTEDPFGADAGPDLDPESLSGISRIELMHLAEAYGVEAEPGLPREELVERLRAYARG